MRNLWLVQRYKFWIVEALTFDSPATFREIILYLSTRHCLSADEVDTIQDVLTYMVDAGDVVEHPMPPRQSFYELP